MVEIYKGKDIDDDKISFLKYISSQKYCKEIYDDYFGNINNVEDLAYLHGTDVYSECLVIGTDWFLCYSDYNSYIEILEWVAKDNENKIKQVAEMMKLFKNLFFQNKCKTFVADMRHDSSYKIYLKMIRKGFFVEIDNYCIMDSATPPEVYDELSQKFTKKFNSIEELLSSDIANNYSQYFKYILHHINFIINPNFIKNYDKNKRKSKERVLKK